MAAFRALSKRPWFGRENTWAEIYCQISSTAHHLIIPKISPFFAHHNAILNFFLQLKSFGRGNLNIKPNPQFDSTIIFVEAI